MRIPVYHGDERPVEPEGQASPPTGPEQPEGYLFSMEPTRPAAPADDYKDLYLRAVADMANFRRRTEERAKEQVEEERRRLLHEFLSFADDLERALAHQSDPGLREGLRLTWAGFRHFLAREGVEPVESAGRPFDPLVHEAVSVVRDEAADGQVVKEVQRGYRYHGRLLRPARVVVGRHE